MSKKLEECFVFDANPAADQPRTKAIIYKNRLDLLEIEFQRRFSAETMTLWTSMGALSSTLDIF